MFPEHGKKVLRMLNVFQSVSPTAQVLLAVTLLWLAGFGMSRITKLLHLPNVTGYILAGVVIGPYVLNLIPAELTGGMEFLTAVALSFIAFGVGRYLRLDRLKEQGTRVIVLTLMEALVTAAVVTLTMLTVFQMSLPFALLLGAIGSATAPASSLMTIRQYRAKGDFVNTLIQVVAMDDAVALLAFSACAAIAAGTESAAGFSVQSALKPLVLSLAMMLGAYLLGPGWGAAAGAVGPALADLMTYPTYVPATLLIKAVMGFAAGTLYSRLRTRGWGALVCGIVGEIPMVVGYWLYDALLLGSAAGAAAGIPSNLVQAAFGIAASTLLAAALGRSAYVRREFPRL